MNNPVTQGAMPRCSWNLQTSVELEIETGLRFMKAARNAWYMHELQRAECNRETAQKAYAEAAHEFDTLPPYCFSDEELQQILADMDQLRKEITSFPS